MHICQAPEWAKFKEACDNKPIKVGEYYFYLTKTPLLGKNVGYLPKVDYQKVDWQALYEAGKKENCIFIKVDPVNPYPEKPPVVPGLKIQTAKGIFAQETTIVDITQSEENLFSKIEKRGRRSIRQAQRSGVRIREGQTDADNEIIIKIQEDTAKRQGFFVHPAEYHRKLWQTLHPAGLLHLLIAEVDLPDPTPVAAWLFFTYDGTIYYPYGGSDYQYKAYQASTLLGWEGIKLGKKLGLKKFDLWGIDTTPGSPWAGFTQFKLTFGGSIFKFADSVDLVIDPKIYYPFLLANKLRWVALKMGSHLRRLVHS